MQDDHLYRTVHGLHGSFLPMSVQGRSGVPKHAVFTQASYAGTPLAYSSGLTSGSDQIRLLLASQAEVAEVQGLLEARQRPRCLEQHSVWIAQFAQAGDNSKIRAGAMPVERLPSRLAVTQKSPVTIAQRRILIASAKAATSASSRRHISPRELPLQCRLPLLAQAGSTSLRDV